MQRGDVLHDIPKVDHRGVRTRQPREATELGHHGVQPLHLLEDHAGRRLELFVERWVAALV